MTLGLTDIHKHTHKYKVRFVYTVCGLTHGSRL